jgi:ABC-type phosphate/phosphonate transport system substrate-binding protein
LLSRCGSLEVVDRSCIMDPTIPDFITLGYAEPEARSKTRERMADLATRLGSLAGIDIGITQLPSYDRVAQLVHHGEIDLAWLSPIPLLALARNQRAVPLVALQRDHLAYSRCAFVVAASSRISSVRSLRGKRAAWVDVHSASGFVLPRIELDSSGVALSLLGPQRFYGSHEAVVRAVASGRADYGATYARIQGDKVVGPWSRTPGMSTSIRVLSTFGEVPPDALAARYDMDRTLRDRLRTALLGMGQDADDKRLLNDVFGLEHLETPTFALRAAARARRRRLRARAAQRRRGHRRGAAGRRRDDREPVRRRCSHRPANHAALHATADAIGRQAAHCR